MTRAAAVEVQRQKSGPRTRHRRLPRSTVGFLALHGGSLERDTDRIAEEAAGASGASLYALRQPDDRWIADYVRLRFTMRKP